ncbi:FAD-binding protein [Anaerocolumna aminovalerica]|uniref:Succinate dehydrogenase/fumarate reductase, flavoprotein subunit n=1 Tax=Anaerocolumna aminovalerica TaxID=1527 RepID=A0A1I5EH12_9FIRM|nr:FAD-binding protein [Anaerocolumna aminovalerica]SFO10822.1 Succinate dehydrogenase/fumarate reductase, flavoprotein subunit [Anaerocolumna aminovalerica]
MKKETVEINGYPVEVYSYNTIVLGTGAAGFNAADRLYQYGQTDMAIITENKNAGTSRNTGSDKQTYYKLTMSGDNPDSVAEMAQTLFEGGCVDGDTALCEAALSSQSFYKLVELGVPFPRNRYGEYVGYKTDHDPRTRATSVGPYTSKVMTECLEKAVSDKNITLHDKMQCIRVLTQNNRFYGILCLNLNSVDKSHRYVLFNAKNIIYATGGPAGMYSDSAYPFGHYGASGLAFQAGVKGKNLTEWQYGLASVKPRWNVSGTYMQVIPRFVSTDEEGGDEREFLFDYFQDKYDLLSKVFLKGYQWPFDVRKIDGGSSIIDLLVYIETCLKGRRVFLDFRENPGKSEIDFSQLTDEARTYLERAGATFGTPYDRMVHMNQPAVDFYRNKGIDLENQMLEIALCAQHNNGGLSTDAWWQTNVEGFFAAGEVSGSHGIYRPGGTALNAGQVGAVRAAQYIARNRQGDSESTKEFLKVVEKEVEETIRLGESCITTEDNIDDMWKHTTKRMSQAGAAIRTEESIEKITKEVLTEINQFSALIKVKEEKQLRKVYRLFDILTSQYVYLSAMTDYVKHGGKSRGSALYSDKSGKKPYDFLPDIFNFTIDDGSKNNQIQEVLYQNKECICTWRQVRPLPMEDNFFETVWREYRENGNIV